VDLLHILPRSERLLLPSFSLFPYTTLFRSHVDPRNVATNFSAGAASGYTLLWVVVAAGLVGVLVQTLTAKLGLATGGDLASSCRDRKSTRLNSSHGSISYAVFCLKKKNSTD